jgi:hypothetical protein
VAIRVVVTSSAERFRERAFGLLAARLDYNVLATVLLRVQA